MKFMKHKKSFCRALSFWYFTSKIIKFLTPTLSKLLSMNFYFLEYLFSKPFAFYVFPSFKPSFTLHSCVGLSFLIKMQVLGQQFDKKGLKQRYFVMKFVKFFETAFSWSTFFLIIFFFHFIKRLTITQIQY